jgi:hypothetical protein
MCGYEVLKLASSSPHCCTDVVMSVQYNGGCSMKICCSSGYLSFCTMTNLLYEFMHLPFAINTFTFLFLNSKNI